MIEGSAPLPFDEIPADHLKAMCEVAPVSGDGLPIYVGAHVFVIVPKLRISGQASAAVACLKVQGVGEDMVFFQHGMFDPTKRVLASRCYFDHLHAVSMVTDGLHKLHAVDLSPDELLETVAPPPAGNAVSLEAYE